MTALVATLLAVGGWAWAGYGLMAACGIVILCVGWRVASDYTYRQSDDIAPGADVARSLPSLYEKRRKR